MTLSNLIKLSEDRLKQASVRSARLDTLLLLEYVLNMPREKILSNQAMTVDDGQLKLFRANLAQRVLHKPIAHIVGWREFYGRQFKILSPVLVPRPESEMMIDELKNLLNIKFNNQPVSLADIGCGSGCLGITAYLEAPTNQVHLIDIDKTALNNTKMNVDLFTVKATVVESDLLDSTNAYFDLIMCNLPYIPDNHPINWDTSYESARAIYGGSDGLEVYRCLFKQIDNLKSKPLYILCESLEFQHANLAKIATYHGYNLIGKNGLIETFAYLKNE